ncbi:MAG: EamA family transporter [Streptosporangiales bacterium]|nr:EamA family transporter [Streptosporangiales bacterium]
MAIALALVCACAYGSSDFLAGVISRRAHYAWVGLFAQGTAAVLVLVAALLVGGDLSASAVGWGALSGVGGGVGSVALYRGFARGQMSVAGPISGAGSAAIPAAAGLLLGERPSAVTLVGVALALPAVWLIASAGDFRSGQLVEGSVDGLLAGGGFGLLFLALSRADADSGLWPTVFGQLVALLAIAVFLAVAVRGATAGLRSRATVLGAAAAGTLGGLATVAFLLASRQGLLVVVSVLAALYPGVTVLLARVLLRERSTRRQLAGLVLAAVAVTVITVG